MTPLCPFARSSRRVIYPDHQPSSLMRKSGDDIRHELQQDVLHVLLRMSYTRYDLGICRQPLLASYTQSSARDSMTAWKTGRTDLVTRYNFTGLFYGDVHMGERLKALRIAADSTELDKFNASSGINALMKLTCFDAFCSPCPCYLLLLHARPDPTRSSTSVATFGKCALSHSGVLCSSFPQCRFEL